MQLVKVGEDIVDVVERVRPLRMARQLRHLPRRKLRVDLFQQPLALLLQPVDLFRNVDRGIVLHETQLVDLRLELGDRLLEIQKRGFCHVNLPLFLVSRLESDQDYAIDTTSPRCATVSQSSASCDHPRPSFAAGY